MDDDVFGRTFKRYQSYKRRADRSAMEALAGIFLLSAFIFWAVAFWQILTPPAILSQLTIQVAVLALVFGVAAPLLWSALLPTTAAGQLLQKSQFATVGYVVTTGAAVYLTYAEFQLLYAWLSGQPQIADGGLVYQIDLALLIAFILIPALAWTQIPFERMIAQIKQNHEINRLAIMQRGDLALLKNHLIRAEVLALRGYANLLPAEQAEVRQTIRGLTLGIADAQRNLARMTGLSADYDEMLGISGDEQVARVMADLAEQLAAPAQLIEGSIVPGREGERDGDAIPVPSPRGSAAIRGDSRRFAEEYKSARSKLSGTWKTRNLVDVLGIKEPRTALDRIYEWEDAGLVERVPPRGTWRFTEDRSAT